MMLPSGNDAALVLADFFGNVVVAPSVADVAAGIVVNPTVVEEYFLLM